MNPIARRFIVAFAALAIALGQGYGQQSVGEIAPHPLDHAFRKRADGNIVNGLINDAHFKRAVAEAAKAMREAEEFFQKNPGAVGASPQRAARARFLEVLNGPDVGVGAAK